MSVDDLRDIEIANILEIIYQKYGFDFRDYSQAHLKRRIRNRMLLSNVHTVHELQSQIVSSRSFAELFLKDLSINVTEMYRDPDFYQSVRKYIIPRLRTYPFFKIWHAGCATGEEVYSMAMLLMEEGLYERSLIYATDFNDKALEQAREGIYPDERIKEYTRNYQLSEGKFSLSDYYTSGYNSVIMDKSLKKNIVWANHNLVTDNVFAEVQVIMCRNVMIYFNKDLQNKVHCLFYESLMKGGFLCLGSKESLKYTTLSDKYEEADKNNRIFIKKY